MFFRGSWLPICWWTRAQDNNSLPWVLEDLFIAFNDSGMAIIRQGMEIKLAKLDTLKNLTVLEQFLPIPEDHLRVNTIPCKRPPIAWFGQRETTLKISSPSE